MKNALILLTATMLFSCSNKSLPQKIPVKSLEIVKERLVPISVPGDSSLLVALFECDSLNNVYLKEISEQKGKLISSGTVFENGRLLYKTIYRHDTILVPVVDTIRTTEIPITVEVTREINRLKWWQEVLVWCGGVFAFFGFYWIVNLIARAKHGC